MTMFYTSTSETPLFIFLRPFTMIAGLILLFSGIFKIIVDMRKGIGINWFSILFTIFASGAIFLSSEILPNLSNGLSLINDNSVPTSTVTDSISKNNNSSTTIQLHSKTPTVTTPSHHGDNLPWDRIGFGAAIILLVIVIGVISWLLFAWANAKRDKINEEREIARKAREAARRLDEQLTNEWNALLMRYSNIRNEWDRYDKDLEKLLQLPAMRDFSVTETGELLEALDEATISKSTQYPSGIQNIESSEFYKKIVKLEKCYNNAINSAERIRNKVMTRKELAQLKLAQQLLSTALNESASSNERQVAYSRVIAIMEDLKIIPPKQVLVEIESKNRLLLEA